MTRRQELEKLLDHEFRWAIRERDNWTCQGGTRQCKGITYKPPTRRLQCSHFVGRAERHTRWDPENGDAQCGGCHMFFTAHPHDHTEWKRSRMSPEAYDALVLRGHTTKKWTVAELEEHLAFLRTWRENMKKVRQHG